MDEPGQTARVDGNFRYVVYWGDEQAGEEPVPEAFATYEEAAKFAHLTNKDGCVRGVLCLYVWGTAEQCFKFIKENGWLKE